ncbi:alpha/beta hydrolase, partial [Gordonia sp. i37]|uniref:alpha/beta fold hydrolase n=1 Tax=Gordonia sp. i37 TaxID=1961707 RepID=UPI0009ACF723
RDGCTLRYRDTDPDNAGGKETLVLLTGWSQTAAMYDKLIDEIKGDYRVVSYDHRNHGESGSTDNGARIASLATDLHELLRELDLHNVNLTGNSMGCSVIWSYLDIYGSSNVRSLTLIDQPSVCALVPWLTDDDAADVGAILGFTQASDLIQALIGDDSEQVRKDFVRSMMMPEMDTEDVEWIYEQNMKLRMPFGAKLVLDHVMQDWRDLLPRIDVPTLVTGGEASHVNATSQEWIAKQIPGAKLHVFTKEDGGDHFPFFQQPKRFADVYTEFLQSV